jgi:hypothetical protein
VRWLERYGSRVEVQIGTRDPGGPNATGPIEQVLCEVDRCIGDRVGSFTNRTRMTKLLELISLDLTRRADGCQWADRIRERLYFAGGRPANRAPTTTPRAATHSSPDPADRIDANRPGHSFAYGSSVGTEDVPLRYSLGHRGFHAPDGHAGSAAFRVS